MQKFLVAWSLVYLVVQTPSWILRSQTATGEVGNSLIGQIWTWSKYPETTFVNIDSGSDHQERWPAVLLEEASKSHVLESLGIRARNGVT